MTISNWLESPDQFRKLLTSLVSDRWEQFMDSLSMEDPVLRQFAATQWAQRRLPDEPDALAVAALLIAYHFRCLLIDSLRSHNLSGNELQEELNVTLLMPLFIWPAYRIWILQESPPGLRVNQMGAVQWLLDSKQRETGFSELEIDEPDSRLLAYLELKRNTTNLSRWIRAGLDRLYHAVHTAVVQAPPARQKPPAVVGESSDANPELEKDDQMDIQDTGISRSCEIVLSGNSIGFSNDGPMWFDSPIFKPYLNWEEAPQTILELHRNGMEFPSLTQVAKAIIDRKMIASNLDIGQQALALELLSELPDWIVLDNSIDQGISLRTIESRWIQFHSSDPAPMVGALLEVGLLQIASQDGYIRFGQQLIHDYYLSLKHVKSRRSTNPIPPASVSLSTWLYWMATHWMECGVPENAGLILWYAAGSLPGYASGSWRQLADILRSLSSLSLGNDNLKLIALVEKFVVSLVNGLVWDARKWLCEIQYFTHVVFFDNPLREMDNILADYVKGLEQYSDAATNTCFLSTLEIALGCDRTRRINTWYRKHAFSLLKGSNPEMEIEIEWIPFVYRSKTLQEILLDFARKEDNWDLRLAALEALVVWGTQKAKVVLCENEIKDLPAEYYHRANILRGAIDGKPGYREWV